MGYLAQRKKHLRTDFILKSLLVLLTLFSVAAFSCGAFGWFVNQWRFQFYLLSLWVMIYALMNRFYLYSFLGLLILLLNFFVVSSAAPVLFSGGEAKEGQSFTVIYQKEPSALADVLAITAKKHADLLALINPAVDNISLSSLLPKGYYAASNGKGGSFAVSSLSPGKAGRINLGGANSAAFVNLAISGRNYVFISFDLSAQTRSEKEKALDYISSFVAAEDDPVIIFGNFGMTAWSPAFGKFLAENRMEVKNDLFSQFLNLITPPTDYIVGYRNLEFVGSCRLPRGDNRYAPLMFRLKI